MPNILSDFNQISIFSTDFYKTSQQETSRISPVEPSCSVRIRTAEWLLYIESSHSYMAPVCAASWFTVRHNRTVMVIARADGSSKYACNSVVFLSENRVCVLSHLHIICIPLNASSNLHFHTTYAIPHPWLQITPAFPVLVPRYRTILYVYQQATQNDLRFINAWNQITRHPSSP